MRHWRATATRPRNRPPGAATHALATPATPGPVRVLPSPTPGHRRGPPAPLAVPRLRHPWGPGPRPAWRRRWRYARATAHLAPRRHLAPATTCPPQPPRPLEPEALARPHLPPLRSASHAALCALTTLSCAYTRSTRCRRPRAMGEPSHRRRASRGAGTVWPLVSRSPWLRRQPVRRAVVRALACLTVARARGRGRWASASRAGPLPPRHPPCAPWGARLRMVNPWAHVHPPTRGATLATRALHGGGLHPRVRDPVRRPQALPPAAGTPRLRATHHGGACRETQAAVGLGHRVEHARRVRRCDPPCARRLTMARGATALPGLCTPCTGEQPPRLSGAPCGILLVAGRWGPPRLSPPWGSGVRFWKSS